MRRGRLGRLRPCGGTRRSGSGGFRGGRLKVHSDEFRVLDIDRAGVRLFFLDANLWQILKDELGLDLEFSRQLVNPDLGAFRHL
jgi:hypothetical protein